MLTVPPLTIRCYGLIKHIWSLNKRKKKKRFEEIWFVDKGCREVVEGVWQASVGGAEDTKVLRKLATCGKELNKWSQKCFGNF